MGKKIIFFLILISFIWSKAGFSQSQEVKFDAHSLRFSFSSNLLIGRGDVSFSYKNLRLYADYAEIDIKNKDIFAKGNVKIFVFDKKGKAEEIKGKAAYYNWSREYFFIDDMEVDISGGELKGVIHVKGETLEYKKFKEKDEAKIICGKLTTCKGDKPAYYFEAKRIMYIPDKRIYAWNVAWYEGKTKIITFPYFIIFLDRPYQLPYIPKLGYSKTDGWFIKNTFNYFVDPYSWGTIYLDWYSKKGVGYGIKHEWEEKDYDVILSLYYLKYKQDEDRDFKTELTVSNWNMGSLSGSFKLSYSTQGDLSYATKKLYGELSLKGDETFPINLKLTYTGSGKTAHDTEKVTANLTYKDKLFNEKLDTNLTLKYTNSVSGGDVSPNLSGVLKLTYNNHSLTYSYKGNGTGLLNNTQKITYTYKYDFSKELKNTLKLYYEAKDRETYDHPDTYAKIEDTLTYKNLSLFLSKYIDVDGPLFTGDENFNFVNKLPEIKYAPGTKKIGKTRINYKYTVIVGNYDDLKADIMAQRYGARLDLSGSIAIGGKFKFSYLLYGEKYLYSTGDSLYDYGGDFKLRGNIGPKTIMEIGFKQKETGGETPFSFDTVSPLKTLSLSIKSREDTLKLSLSGGYDYIKKEYKKVIGSIVYEPSDSFKGTFKLGYDLNKGSWTKLIGDIEIKFGENWKVDYSASLSTKTMKIENNKVVLTYSLPCEREVSLSYDQKKEEYWFEYNILALPSPIISIGSGR